MSDEENIVPDPHLLCPPSPPSPVAKKKDRRSSIAAARRLSRASTMGGALFEELLGAIPGRDQANTQQRLEKLLQLVVSSSVRTTLEHMKEENNEDMEDSATDVSKTLRLSTINKDIAEDVVKMIDDGVEIDGDVVGGELKKMREYTEQLEAEGVRWKEMYAERREMYKNADRNAKDVKTGVISLNDEEQWNMTGEERLKLKRVTELCKAAVTQLSGISTTQDLLSLRDIGTANVRQNKELKDNNDKLCLAVRKLTNRADSVAEKL